jgi:hypothetical protein
VLTLFLVCFDFDEYEIQSLNGSFSIFSTKHCTGKTLILYCKICLDYLVPKNRVAYLTNIYLTDWPEWFVQLHSLVEIHVGCQIGDHSLSVVERGHSTTMWTKVYPVLTTPSNGQLWTFYMLPSSYYHPFIYVKKRGLSLGHLPTSCPRSYWMTPESENQSWGDSLIDFHLPSWCHLTWHFTVCACWSLITKFVVYENST